LNIDRLLREVESRLADRDEADRGELMDVLREAVARERRWLDPSLTVEAERERRVNAEELKGAFEAIHRSVRPAEALDEVLKQFDRVVATDFAVLAVAEPGSGLRIAAVRGAELEVFAGALLTDDPRVTLAREERRAVAVAEGDSGTAPFPLVGAPPLQAWMVLPLLLEGDFVGVLVAGRRALDAFSPEELQRAKAVASFTAATLQRVQRHEQLSRYATLLERVVDVDQRAFRGETPEALAAAILDGACRVGGYRGGMLILHTTRGPVVAAASGDAFAGAVGRTAPDEWTTDTPRRVPAGRMLEIGEALGLQLPGEQTYLVPLVAPDAQVGALALVDPSGESPEDRLIEAYAARTALAFRYATGRPSKPL
jgi:hypothetical protein